MIFLSPLRPAFPAAIRVIPYLHPDLKSRNESATFALIKRPLTCFFKTSNLQIHDIMGVQKFQEIFEVWM
jgi:hypothetical protein